MAGTIKRCGGGSAPLGWLELNGQTFNVNTNKELAKIFPSGVEIYILHKEENISEDQNFCNDLCEIVTVFSSRLYGKRSHKNKKLLS